MRKESRSARIVGHQKRAKAGEPEDVSRENGQYGYNDERKMTYNSQSSSTSAVR